MTWGKKTGGMLKGYKYTKKRSWYNNGVEETLYWEDDCIPEGWIPGRLKNHRPAWNRGLTKDINPSLAKMSKSKKGNISWNKMSDDYLRDHFINNVNNLKEFLNYWDTHGYLKCCNYFQLSPRAIKRLIKMLNLESIEEHHRRIFSQVMKSPDYRAKQSARLKGRKSPTKGKKRNPVSTQKWIQTMSLKTSDDYRRYKQKEHETKLKNGTYSKHITNDEKEVYKILIKYFNEEDIIYQYFDSIRYPFNCDFYIKSKDLFIEVNGYPSHGGHPFNVSDPRDIKTLLDWNIKVLVEGKKQYQNWLYTWTDLDVRKRATASAQKLNYLSLFNVNDLEEYLSCLPVK